MKRLAGALFIAAWLCFQAQSRPLMVPADCNEARIGKVAGVALDLLNKYRREGYVFALVRVADAQELCGKNASLIYLTLDVVETQCPVISRKHWSSCGHRRVLKITDLGQCKAVVYMNELTQEEKLCAYNCTISPVPPQFYECKRCFEKTTVLEDVDNYKKHAIKILEQYTLQSKEANYFKVQKIQKAFEVHLGFCRGQTAKNSGVVEAHNCEIYDVHNGSVYLFHHHSGESCPHCNVSEHKWRHVEDPKNIYNSSEQSQEKHHDFSSFSGPCFHLPTLDVPHNFSPGKYFSHPVDSVYHIPMLNEHDVLQAPGANFLDQPHGRHKEHILPDQHGKLFPEVPSASCPGSPRYDFNQTFLSLFPVPSAD